MKKTYVAIVLLATLFLSITAMSASVKATGTAMMYGHLAPNYDNNEKNLETNVCNQISWYFSNDPWSSCSPTNYYWTYTDSDDVNVKLNSQTSGYVTNWWVGDYTPIGSTPPPFGHFGFYGQGSNIEDKDIYGNATHSGTSVQYFDFIWTCANGGIYWNDSGGHNSVAGIDYPGVNVNQSNNRPSYMPLNTNTQYGTWYNGAVGMPYAWTGTTSMSTNGYWSSSGDYCYIGWEGPSTTMQTYLYGTSTNAATFADLYYEYALGYFNSANNYAHLTFGQSLDAACLGTYGNYYTSTPLFNGYWTWVAPDPIHHPDIGSWYTSHLLILGNSYNSIPYPPSILIDSSTGGCTDPSAGYYTGSGVQTIYAYAYDGYSLDHWNLNGGYLTGAVSPIYVDYNSHWEVTPVFVMTSWVNIIAGDGGYTTPAAGIYPGTDEGSGYMQITAYPYSGHAFSYWLLNGGYLSSDQTIWVDYSNGYTNIQPVFT